MVSVGHFVGDVYLRAVLPAINRFQGIIDHRPGIIGDAFGVQGGCGQFPLPLPEFAVAGQQTVAQKSR